MLLLLLACSPPDVPPVPAVPPAAPAAPEARPAAADAPTADHPDAHPDVLAKVPRGGWEERATLNGRPVFWRYCSAENPGIRIHDRDGTLVLTEALGQEGVDHPIERAKELGPNKWRVWTTTGGLMELTWDAGQLTVGVGDAQVFSRAWGVLYDTETDWSFEQIHEPNSQCWDDEMGPDVNAEWLAPYDGTWAAAGGCDDPTLIVMAADKILLDNGDWPIVFTALQEMSISLTLGPYPAQARGTRLTLTGDDALTWHPGGSKGWEPVQLVRCPEQ